MNTRIDLKVITAGDSWITGFNGTMEEAKAYFIGIIFEGRAPVVRVEEVGKPTIPAFKLMVTYRPYICSVCGFKVSLQTNHTADLVVNCSGCSWKGASFDPSRKGINTIGRAVDHTNRRFVYYGDVPADINPN